MRKNMECLGASFKEIDSFLVFKWRVKNYIFSSVSDKFLLASTTRFVLLFPLFYLLNN